MRMMTSSFLRALVFATLVCWHLPAIGGVQVSENFDSTNSWGSIPLPSSGYTNTATNVTGWVINNAAIIAGPAPTNTTPSYPYVVRTSGTASNAYIITPWLSNGVGSVVFSARLVGNAQPNQVVLESNFGGANWTGIGITNSITTTNWMTFTNSILSTSNQFVRFRKLNYSAAQYSVFFDSIAVTYPPAVVAVTNLTLSPSAPMENDSMAVTAILSLSGNPDVLSATNYWKISSNTNWTAIPMVTNQPTVFTTASNIPSQPAFTPIDYFVQVVQTSDGLNFVTTSITNTISIRPRSSYTNMVVTSPINAPLTLSSTYQWQGVAYVSNTLSAFKFQGTSNGVDSLWGDSNQTISNYLAYGNADAGATNIILSTTNIGLHLFTFNESDLTYRVRACVRENFDLWSNQPFDNTTNQWIVTNGSVTNDTAGTYSNSYLTLNSDTTSSLISPLLTNGIGHISFWYRKWGTLGAPSGTLAVQVAPTPSSTNWTTIASVSNITATTYSFVSFPWADLNNQAVRILNNPSGGNSRVSLDEVVISAPGGSVSITNVTLNPSLPMAGDAIAVTAKLAMNGFLDAMTATNYWKLSSDSNWTAIPMSSNAPTVFTTITSIPSQQAFTPIDYFVRVTPTIDGISTFAMTSTNTITIRPRSSYTNMVVTSPINASLTLSSNNQWQGVAYVSNALSTFKFQGTSNGVDTLWGDSNQAISNMMAYGDGNVGATNIILSTTNTGLHLFTFNDSDATYSVRSCVRENFESWANQPFGTFTNQWILANGSVTNDLAGTYLSRYAILESNATSYLLSPLLTNGIGHISFWYRRWGSPGSPSGALAIQVAPSPDSTTWTTIASLTNITSPFYSFVSIPWADLNNQAVRILNNPSGGNSRVSLDEVVVAAPGAAVYGANLTNSPSAPGSLDMVNIAIDLTTNAWATLTNVVVWYRGATNLLFQSLPLIQSGSNHYVTSNGLPPTLGTVQYAVEYRYSGLFGISPAFYPSAGTNQPYSFTTTNTVANYRYEPFDSTSAWGSIPLPASGYTNTATNVTGWVINNAAIIAGPAPTNTTPSYPYVVRTSGTASNAYIITPWLSNGVGSVVFSARLFGNAQPNQVVLESNFGDANWTGIGITNSITTTNWMSFTNSILSASNQFVRFRKLNYSAAQYSVFFDSITCTPYPAYLAVTNIILNPGYPAVGQSVTASCDILSLNPFYPAFSITPTLYWSLPGGVTNAVPMVNSSGNTYTTSYPFVLTNALRDYPVTYWIMAAFAGYHSIPADDLSPRRSMTNTFNVRAFSSSYSNVAASINGTSTPGRLLTNGIWQAVVSTSATNLLSFSLSGYGYSSGSGASTNIVQWGNTNNWQTSFPLADAATTGQTNITISGSFSGQFVVRFDERTGQYLILRCVSQDFDKAGGGNGTPYVQQSVSGNSAGQSLSFNDWPVNISQSRLENFNQYGSLWSTISNYTDVGDGGYVDFLSWGMIYTNVSGTPMMRTRPSVLFPDDSFFAQATHWPPVPSITGIDTISIKVRTISNFTGSASFYLMPTNGVNSANDLNNYAAWIKPPIASWSGISNNISTTTLSYSVKTNATMDVIYSVTQNMCIAELSISDWYALDNSTNGWTAYQSWITTIGGGNACLFQASRSAPGTEQYLLSPAITGGISTISFDYSSPATTPTSVALDVSYSGPPYSWTNLLTINNVVFNGTGTDLINRQYALLSAASPIYVRIKNLTPAPGGLIIDNVQISGFATSNDWYMNSAAIKYQAQAYPPASRQFYMGAGYLNSNRTSEISTLAELIPSTNVFPSIRTPSLANGVGEISFWYRNWAANSAVAPARLFIQKSVTGNSSATGDWTYVDAITNIVNTNDYIYYQGSIYDTSCRYIRICNDDTNTVGVGRVCLDDIIVTEPLASSLSLSNLVITPAIPLYTNTVDVAVDVYNLFYAPTNLTLTAYYGTASSYTGLASAGVSTRPMTCVASNLTTLGQSYRYQTSSAIPANASDTFVKYYVSATFGGYHPEAFSPRTNNQFTVYPSWLYPLNSVNGTNSAYYVVFSCPTGSVWINEFNIIDYSFDPPYTTKSNQYVELCGNSGIDIRNWPIQILNSLAQTQAVYTITNNTTLNNTTNGFGFWVLGKSAITEKQQALTNDLPTAGGFRLSRPSGVTADSLCYTINSSPSSGVSSLINQGFKFVGLEDDYYETSVILVGSNTNGLTWALGNDTYYSPGQINDGQILYSVVTTGDTNPPVINIYSFRVNTNIWVECGGTNNWVPTPWYSTNLMNTNGWSVVTPYGSTYPTLSPSNTYTINFPKAPFTNSPVYFFKVVTTNAP